MRQTYFAALLLIMYGLLACAPEGSGPQTHKVVPNETREPILETVPNRTGASEAGVLAPASEADLETMRAIADPHETPPAPARPDLRELTPEERRARAEQYRQTLLKPLPLTRPNLKKPRQPKPIPPALATPARQVNPSRPSGPSSGEAAPPRPGGGRVLEPHRRPSTALARQLLPPGRFLSARLVGNVEVSLFAPVVWAEIFDAHGRRLGTATGSATLHNVLTDRALLVFQEIRLDDGRTLTGSFAAFELDLSQGVQGRVERRRFQKFLRALVDVVLAGLALEVEPGNDSFFNYFRFQITNQLLGQGRQELQNLDVHRVVRLPRGRRFWIASVGEASLRERAPAALSALTRASHEAFRGALQSDSYAQERRQALEKAHQLLNQRLQALQGVSR